MSYDIFIGNAVPVYPEDDEDGFRWRVERVKHQDAPRYEDSGTTNGRHPGYLQMSNWCDQVGLRDLFYNEENGLLRPHPGIRRLRNSHLDAVACARAAWERSHHGSVPGFDDGQDSVLARLVWYEWWMRWALENCEHPAVQNF